jgi:hypothetical protein
MRLVDFDARVARANGFEVVTLPDGSRASVPAAKAAAARKGEYVPKTGVLRKAPANGGGSAYGYGALPGDCGVSWVSLEDRGSDALLLTGFELVPAAGSPWDVHWKVNINDNGGSSSQSYDEYDGFEGFLSWTAYARWLRLTPGWAFATVVWFQSWTVTGNGWVCWSAGPSASEQIV